MNRNAIQKTLDEYAPERSAIELRATCHVCRGPLVDGWGNALPLPRSFGRRMPLRARAALLASFTCCACAGCDICIAPGPNDVSFEPDEAS